MNHPGCLKLKPGPDNIAILTPQSVKGCHEDVKKLINDIGAMSTKVQGLNHVITTFSSFCNGDNRIYMLISEDKKQALGFVKVGTRHLFFWDHTESHREYTILALLDFFVVPSSQRKGYGKTLIDKMLATEGKQMKDIPIDRPSPLCLSFMKKHFGLSEFTPQSNNYVIFEQFWGDDEKEEQNKGSGLPYLVGKSRTPRMVTPTTTKQQSSAFSQTNQPYAYKARTPVRRLNPITWLPY